MVSCLLGAILLDAFLVSGLFVPVRVTSGSMAPGLRGPHRSWHCNACGQEFACGLESLPAARRPAICPYCRAQNDQSAGVDRPGTRVLVDRATPALFPLRRWESVVLGCPQSPSAWCVKRVAGLPGERVAIRDGDVWINNAIMRKPHTAAREMAVLVHTLPTADDDHKDAPRRWISETDHWQWTGHGFQHAAETPGNNAHRNAPIRWLEYRHPSPTETSAAETAEPILDESPYDQDEIRAFAAVNDLLLTGEFTRQSGGTLFFRSTAGSDLFVAQIDLSSGSVKLEHNGQTVDMAGGHSVRLNRSAEFAWMLADQLVQLSVDGHVLIQTPYEPTKTDGPTAPAQLAIGVRAADVTIEKLTLFRDVYYTPGPPDGVTEYQLGPDEYFLLGDNSPHSQDGRWWSEPGVSLRNIVGRVLRW